MVAAPPFLLSDEPPDLVRRARIGDHFHYWRGRSGRRYLFTAVDDSDLADFQSVVVLLAEPSREGRLAARAVAVVDEHGRALCGERPWPRHLPAGTLLLVHLLAESDQERHALVADLMPAPVPVSLAA